MTLVGLYPLSSIMYDPLNLPHNNYFSKILLLTFAKCVAPIFLGAFNQSRGMRVIFYHYFDIAVLGEALTPLVSKSFTKYDL
jgi:hypothetical protein